MDDERLALAGDLDQLRQAAASCTACPLYERATQAVFGAGTAQARIVLVGEQPGDKEDRAGTPFVGPAGKLLHEAMGAANMHEDDVYVTNAVKHFKWEQRGKARLHKKPSLREVRACAPWLEAELATIDPVLVLLLGATAAQSLLGSGFKVTEQRGRLLALPGGRRGIATVHPSSLLRLRDRDERRTAMELFVADLRRAVAVVATALASDERGPRDAEAR